MSNNDNYWSDEDNSDDNELIQDDRGLPPLDIDSEEEEELQNILSMVSSKLKNDDDLNYDVSISKNDLKKDLKKILRKIQKII